MTDTTPQPNEAEGAAQALAELQEISEQTAVRLAKRERLIASGGEAYPVGVPITTTIPAVRVKFPALEADAATGDIVGLAGRVVHSRNTGKLCFASLQSGDGSRIQAMVSLAEVGQEKLDGWKDLVDLGDHVFVAGEVISSRRGELSVQDVDLGFFSFNLVNLSGAKNIASGAAERTYIAPLGAFYRDIVLPNWGFFGAFLIVAELAIGLGLIFGAVTRLAAVGGLLLIAPIWVMQWHTGLYLWEYPAEDLMPLALLATVPAGRIAGLDARIAPRFHHRWPF